ncbi:hypothetical protein [Primorskyibacter sedentarius]|uniref:hypothetical protein n=1 Tax=Primorskyibacter sedentarius TaxID=745311 RepID=UPI0010466D2C|nr:hypothetical protein [Primorskyibacter sedentarius]
MFGFVHHFMWLAPSQFAVEPLTSSKQGLKRRFGLLPLHKGGSEGTFQRAFRQVMNNLDKTTKGQFSSRYSGSTAAFVTVAAMPDAAPSSNAVRAGHHHGW